MNNYITTELSGTSEPLQPAETFSGMSCPTCRKAYVAEPLEYDNGELTREIMFVPTCGCKAKGNVRLAKFIARMEAVRREIGEAIREARDGK